MAENKNRDAVVMLKLSDIDGLKRYLADCDGNLDRDSSGDLVMVDDILALVANAPVVSGEAVIYQYRYIGKDKRFTKEDRDWKNCAGRDDYLNIKINSHPNNYEFRELFTNPQPIAPSADDVKDAELYRYLRNKDLSEKNTPCIAIQLTEKSGTFVNHEDADNAIREAIFAQKIIKD